MSETGRQGRNTGWVLQGMLIAWVLSILAIPAILLLSGEAGRGDRLFGAWLMLAIQALLIGVVLVSFVAV